LVINVRRFENETVEALFTCVSGKTVATLCEGLVCSWNRNYHEYPQMGYTLPSSLSRNPKETL